MKTDQKKPLKIAVIFYTVFIAFLIAFSEIFLGIFDREEVMVRGDDPDMVYSLIPNRSGIAMTPEYRVNVAVDSHGMRNCIAPPSDKKASLLILGDSFSEGWGVECESSFPGLLSRKLPDIQVWNGGTHGGSLSYYILRFRHYRDEVRPDLLLLQIFDNDLDDLDKIHDMIDFDKDGAVLRANPKGLLFLPAGKISSFIKNTSLFRFAKRLANNIRGIPSPIKYYKVGREPAEAILTHDEAISRFGKLECIKDISEKYNGQFEFYKYDQKSMPDKWKSRFSRFELYLNQLYGEAKKFNPEIKIAILYIPAKEVFAKGGIEGRIKDLSGEMARGDRRSIEMHDELFKLLERFSSRNHIKLISGIDIYHENPEDLYFPGDAHLNSAGHSVTAAAVMKWIQEK